MNTNNNNESNYSVVRFHIGRDGKFNDGGYKEFEGVYNLQDVISFRDSYLFLNNTDENGNVLPDNEWTLTDNSGRELLSGREEIESKTGTLDFDGDYDTEICKYLDECDDSEIDLIYEEIKKGGNTSGLTRDDVIFIADESQEARDDWYDGYFVANGDPQRIDSDEAFEDVVLAMQHSASELGVFTREDGQLDSEDWNDILKKLYIAPDDAENVDVLYGVWAHYGEECTNGCTMWIVRAENLM